MNSENERADSDQNLQEKSIVMSAPHSPDSESGNGRSADFARRAYEALHELAAAYLRQERPNHTLQPTALVHEAYLRLIDQTNASWNDRAHFFAVAARAMRQILVNHAERKRTLKRGGDRRRLQLDEDAGPTIDPLEDVLALNEALTELETLDERKSRVVEARFFGGLRMEDIATVMGLSITTVESDWRMARAWLAGKLDARDDAGSGADPQ